MHELAICQALLDQVASIASEHGAERVSAITVRVGALSGVEPPLLSESFVLAREASRLAANAELTIEQQPARVSCRECARESEVQPNRLLCGWCGATGTRLIAGDELLLARVELASTADTEALEETTAP